MLAFFACLLHVKNFIEVHKVTMFFSTLHTTCQALQHVSILCMPAACHKVHWSPQSDNVSILLCYLHNLTQTKVWALLAFFAFLLHACTFMFNEIHYFICIMLPLSVSDSSQTFSAHSTYHLYHFMAMYRIKSLHYIHIFFLNCRQLRNENTVGLGLFIVHTEFNFTSHSQADLDGFLVLVTQIQRENERWWKLLFQGNFICNIWNTRVPWQCEKSYMWLHWNFSRKAKCSVAKCSWCTEWPWIHTEIRNVKMHYMGNRNRNAGYC